MCLQRTKEERQTPRKISPDILEVAGNQVHQLHHRVQLNHYKMSTMKYKNHLKSPYWMDRWTVPKITSPSSFSRELPVLILE
jgi:hypothetical protein